MGTYLVADVNHHFLRVFTAELCLSASSHAVRRARSTPSVGAPPGRDAVVVHLLCGLRDSKC